MLHDMSLTERYAVLSTTCPSMFDLELAMGGRGFPYRWDADYPPASALLPRDGGDDDVQWFDVEPCYVFHPMNAYDDGDAS